MQYPERDNALYGRIEQSSRQLNALRSIAEPQPASRLPLLGPLVNLLRRLVNQVFTRWYVSPMLEQQARFNEQVTAAFDTLSQIAVEQEMQIQQLGRVLGQFIFPGGPVSPGEVSAPNDLEALFHLPPEALSAWENADVPPPAEKGSERRERASWYDLDKALSFPLHWQEQVDGWHYLFNLAVVGVALDCRPGDLVLDLAGSSGWVSEFLARFHMQTVLLDCEEDLLRTSRTRLGMDRRLEKCPPHRPVAGDALRLPFADATFDGVICMNALHHMPSYETTLRELYRVLKPGGRAVFGEPGDWHARSTASQIGMREYGATEKNMPLPLIYVHARRAGFARMWQYPYVYPEWLESPYPEEAASTAAILRRMAQLLPDWIHVLSLFSLEKEGRAPPTSNLSPLQQQRCRLRAEITLLDYRDQVPAGSPFVERALVRNTGDVIWLAGPRHHGGYVRLGVKLCDEEGRLLRDSLERVSLPRDIAPGEEVELNVPVEAPPKEGRYLLKYDLVNEDHAWFQEYGSEPVEHSLQVLPEGDPVSG